MRRLQVYLPEELHRSLKIRSRSTGLSVSALIRRTLEKDNNRDRAAETRAFFEGLKPLQSFADFDSK